MAGEVYVLTNETKNVFKLLKSGSNFIVQNILGPSTNFKLRKEKLGY